MKYTWNARTYWKGWLTLDFKKWYYNTFFKWRMGALGGTMIPKTGKGKYVSVYRKGDIIQIIDEESIYDEIRIIPYQPNHGIMVERLKNGKVQERNNLDIMQLNKNIIFASNVEQLADRNKK